MSDTTLDRIGGGVLAAGAALSTIGYVMGSIDEPGARLTPAYVDTPLYLTENLLPFIGAGLILVGLPALVATHWGRGRVLTLLGAIGFGIVMLIQGVGNGFVNVTVVPPLIDDPATQAFVNNGAPGLMGVMFDIGMAGWILGGPLLGIGVLRAHVVHRWIGVLLLVATLAGLVSFVLPQAFESLGAILSCVAILALGVDLLRPQPLAAGALAPATAA